MDKAGLFARYERATADLEPPFAMADLDAFWDNAASMTTRAAGKTIRLASKSVRCRELQRQVLATDGFDGILAFTLPEALWLAGHGFDDVVVAYPTVDRSALRELATLTETRPEKRVVVMIDSIEHLDLIDSATTGMDGAIEVCLDLDAGLWLLDGRVRIGAKRSPVHSVDDAVSLARAITARKGFSLVGMMAYEAQVAGMGDDPPGQPLKARAVRAMQKRSMSELAQRRAEVVLAVSDIAPLRFVNGGGTGSIERTAEEDHVTEIGAGSGLFAPALFDAYTSFDLRPAAMFVLPVVRRSKGASTALGGGYLASGPADRSRLPAPFLPEGLRLDPFEGAGEVQTPLRGRVATRLRPGDRVYMRHAKAGEMCERFDRLYGVRGDKIVDEFPTYRGEGRTFL